MRLGLPCTGWISGIERSYNGTDANMQPYFGTDGLTVNEETYTSPAIEAHFGAYGTK